MLMVVVVGVAVATFGWMASDAVDTGDGGRTGRCKVKCESGVGLVGMMSLDNHGD